MSRHGKSLPRQVTDAMLPVFRPARGLATNHVSGITFPVALPRSFLYRLGGPVLAFGRTEINGGFGPSPACSGPLPLG
jgi:hypothetical protein